MAVVLNFSQSWALYCLVQFYTVTKEELAHIKPLAKFLTFKSIVFLTWWQGVAIALLSTFGLFKSPIAQGLQFKSSVQDFIICIEVDVLHFSLPCFFFFGNCIWNCNIIFIECFVYYILKLTVVRKHFVQPLTVTDSVPGPPWPRMPGEHGLRNEFSHLIIVFVGSELCNLSMRIFSR